MKEQIVKTNVAKEILARQAKVRERIEEMLLYEIADSKRTLHSKLNKMIYELAEKQGVSIWDICFSYAPQICYEEDFIKGGNTFRMVANIVPLRMDIGGLYCENDDEE